MESSSRACIRTVASVRPAAARRPDESLPHRRLIEVVIYFDEHWGPSTTFFATAGTSLAVMRESVCPPTHDAFGGTYIHGYYIYYTCTDR